MTNNCNEWIKHNNILVIGDVMLDIYCSGEVDRISPEAPVPILKKKCERYVLGGASNVAANLVAATQKTSILALIGDDDDGKKIKELLDEIGVDSSLLFFWNRPTITKTRFLAENNQQVFRLDIEDSSFISSEEECLLMDKLKKIINAYDLIILSDYMKGIFTYKFTQSVIRLADEHNKRVLVDVKDTDFEKYRGAWLLKPNAKELNTLTKMPVSTADELVEATQYLLNKVECKYVLTTCGSKGMTLVGQDIIYHLDTVGKSVYDVTGAGDTVIAYLATALASEIEIKEAIRIANYAAGIQVGRIGTSAIYLHEVKATMFSDGEEKKQRIFRLSEREQLMNLITEWRNKDEMIVTTNGCFDILHRGHISLLEKAKKSGDRLIVIMNTDASVKRLKGLNRPINSEEDRAKVIAALDCVDAVVLFDPVSDNKAIPESDLAGMNEELKRVAMEAPMGILKLISPDVHVKGGDYSVKQVPEAIYAKEFKAVPFIEGYSTTKIIQKSQR